MRETNLNKLAEEADTGSEFLAVDRARDLSLPAEQDLGSEVAVRVGRDPRHAPGVEQ